ncbi:histidine phosphatase family protein [Liquorilactobacillus mali]|nr:histidine phosphatase family protein [Liquorilactobacillus mali]MDN7145724.1 histidine phosphatase family protein [Liquorilactobacillus mali]
MLTNITNIYFVRHALPDYSWADDAMMPLTQVGKDDSLVVLDSLKNLSFDFCISSPYKRTLQTIEPLVYEKKLKVHIDERLKERVRGDIGENGDVLLKKRWGNFDFHEENGESMNSLQQRNMEVLSRILEQHRGETILFSTHGAALSSMLNHFDNEFGYLDFIRLQCFTPYVLKISFDKNNKIVDKEEILIIDKK